MSTTDSATAVTPAAPAAPPALAGLRSLIAGGVGGVCAVVTGHPFDLIKVRLQTAEKGVYTGAIDCVRKTVTREGLVRGMYAGVSAPLVGVTPMFAVSFWGYDMGKNIVRALSPGSSSSSAPLTTAQISAAGFFSAIPQTIITAPFERVKVLLQIQGQSTAPPKYKGGADVVRQLYLEGGVKSVFRGSLATLARDGPGSAAYFATYEICKKQFTVKGADPSLGAIMMAGGLAGVAMWILVFPVDTVKSKLQSGDGKLGLKGVVKEVYAKGGFKAFFPGIGPALCRSFPANAATFLGVEMAHKAMDRVF
ncbi:putative mitochondrial carnitine:acyl carnitine carrier [Peziza echinospora]|nr:putative mitochondrial carnitine:acyl carnitine carrier [Peziza echinospora]